MAKKASYSLATRYVIAFINYLSSKNALDKYQKIVKDFEKIAYLYKESEDFRYLINNPLLSHEKIAKTCLEIIKSKDEHLEMFLKVIFKKKRQNLIPLIFDLMKAKAYEMQNEIEVKLITAYKLKKHLLEELKAVLKKKTGRDIVFVEEKDKNIIGGFAFIIEDKLYDYTVKGYLERLKRTFLTTWR